MIDHETEHLLSMTQAAKTLPGKPDVATLWRWRTAGCRGVKLETMLYGGRRYTSSEAIRRFLNAINGDPIRSGTPPSAIARSARGKTGGATRSLKRIGPCPPSKQTRPKKAIAMMHSTQFGLEPHTLAATIPPMSEDEYASLKSDIEANGLREPITLLDGKILDGRHRFRACKELNIKPATREMPKALNPVAYVLSLNLHRRHLAASQRAMIGIAVEKELAKAAKQRQRLSKGAAKKVWKFCHTLMAMISPETKPANWLA